MAIAELKCAAICAMYVQIQDTARSLYKSTLFEQATFLPTTVDSAWPIPELKSAAILPTTVYFAWPITELKIAGIHDIVVRENRRRKK